MNGGVRRGRGESLAILVVIAPNHPLYTSLAGTDRTIGVPRTVRLLQLATIGLLHERGGSTPFAPHPVSCAPAPASQPETAHGPVGTLPPLARRPVTRRSSHGAAPAAPTLNLGLDAFDLPLS